MESNAIGMATLDAGKMEEEEKWTHLYLQPKSKFQTSSLNEESPSADAAEQHEFEDVPPEPEGIFIITLTVIQLKIIVLQHDRH